MLLYRCLLFAGLFFTFLPCAGQSSASAPAEQTSLYPYQGMPAGFSCRIMYSQGSGVIAPWLGNNAAELAKLDRFIAQALSHPTLFISRIRLTGYSSIEGSYARNELLAQERVAGLYAYLCDHYPALYRYPYDRAWGAEDWDGLSRLVKESPLREREEILKIIRTVPVYDTRESLLAKLDGGYPWLFMEREVFPQLRRAEIQITIDHSIDNGQMTIDNYRAQPTAYESTPTATVTTATTQPTTASPQPSPKERESDAYTIHTATTQPTSTIDNGQMTNDNDKAQPTVNPNAQPTVNYQLSTVNSSGEGWGEAVGSVGSQVSAVGSRAFVLKTNLLLLAGVQSDFTYTTPVLNGALEYFFTPNWSVEAGVMYSYWRYNSRREFQGLTGYRLEPRYRLAFPGNRFGTYLGLYGRVGDYDSMTIDNSIDNGQMTNDNYNSTLNYTGNYWDAGLSAGLTVRLVGGLGLEVGARAGYVRSSPEKYIRKDNQNRFESRWRYTKVGVTDLNVSLIYTIQPHPGPLQRRGR